MVVAEPLEGHGLDEMSLGDALPSRLGETSSPREVGKRKRQQPDHPPVVASIEPVLRRRHEQGGPIGVTEVAADLHLVGQEPWAHRLHGPFGSLDVCQILLGTIDGCCSVHRAR